MNVLTYELTRVFGHANYDVSELDTAAAARALMAAPSNATAHEHQAIWASLPRLPKSIGPCLHREVRVEHLHDAGCDFIEEGGPCCQAHSTQQTRTTCAQCGVEVPHGTGTIVARCNLPRAGGYWQ